MATTLATLGWLGETFSKHGIAYWIFGGFAVDFHVGEETRVHDDVDVAVLREDFARARKCLIAAGWTVETEVDGYATFERDGARIDLAPVAATNDPGWPANAFGDDIRELDGVRVRVVTRSALVADKSERHEDATTRAKDEADLRRLERS